jgi:hypothetical protein
MEVITVSAGGGNVLVLFVLMQLAALGASGNALAVNYNRTVLGVGAEVAAWFTVVST